MTITLQVFIFIFGIIVGSFINAVLWRLRTKESFVFGRSYCPRCQHELFAIDLLPLFSYLLLRGRCRYCRNKISWSYFIIELVMGVMFLLAAQRLLPSDLLQLSAESLSHLLLTWYLLAVLTVVFVFDLRYMLILRSVTLPAAILAAAANLALGMSWQKIFLGIVVCAGFFWLQRLLSGGRWIGGGDVQLGILMGAALGFPIVLVAMFLSYIVGAVFGVALLSLQHKGWKSELPFGTFLSAATAACLLYGQHILNWYFGLL